MRILLADDDQITLRLLENSLRRSNYKTILANDGEEAWKILTTPPVPEIALLDWMMPGIDGTEICRRLRLKDKDVFVYAILVTSNDRPEDITAGLDAGANDYITKPFDKDELKSRIAVGARVVSYEKSLKAANEKLVTYSMQMETLAQERAQQLVQADRMISLGTMAAGIAHEINNPLTIAQGNLNLLRNFWNQFGEPAYTLKLEQTEQRENFQPLPEDVKDMITTSEKAVKRLRSIVDGMRTFSHGQGGTVEELNPETCLMDAIQICLPKTKQLCQIESDIQDIPFPVMANPVQITQVLVNLIANAADALAGTPNPSIAVQIMPENEMLNILVTDNGPGITKESLGKLWSPLFTTKPKGQGTGLGLAICLKIVQDHGGDLRVKSEVSKGTTFTLLLPSASEYQKHIQDKPDETPGTKTQG